MQAQSLESTPEAPVPERPARAPGVDVIGALRDSAFREGQWLIRRGERFIQVSEPLYRVAEYANGERTAPEIALLVSRDTHFDVTAQHVDQMLTRTLIPLGIVEPDEEVVDGDEEPDLERPALNGPSPSALSVNLRMRLLGPRVIDPATRCLQLLYHPILLLPLLILVGAAHWWLYAVHGFASPVHDALVTPGAVVGVLALYLAAAVCHEFGHASALRYGGGRARAIGVGIYLIYPVFYTDTTDSYRLGRWGRVRTDLGGFYFSLLFALATVAVYFASGQEWLLLLVFLVDLDIVRQLFPFVRFDGYWALTDLLGVPDVLSHLKSTLTRGREPSGVTSRVPALRPWARAVFGIYTLFTVPILAALLGLMLVQGPRMFVAVVQALVVNFNQLQGAWSSGQAWTGIAAGAGLVLLVIQAIGMVFLLTTIVWQPVQASWRWSGSRTVHRTVTVTLSAAAIAVLLAYWTWSLSRLL